MKISNGYVINFSDCPVLWKSQLQTETSLLDIQAEIIALDHCCRKLFLIMDMKKNLGEAVVLLIGYTTTNFYYH